jgi:2-polyprenyl-6-hydroxyphenyl methylase/3-demethylubiquinone-9 3-methyltransferase
MDRFAFGDNWKAFSQRIGPQDYQKAKASVQRLVPDLEGKTFLDVGCGSGLFSMAASSLGASQVIGFDVDPASIEASRTLLDKVVAWDIAIRKERVRFEVESILNPSLDRSQYDVVYSWGVLHHTGQMHKAFEAIKDLVRPGGRLVIAIYNRHWTAPIWKAIKWTYVKLPRFLRFLIVWPILLVKLLVAILVLRQNPFNRDRGMRYYTDIVDWVGGYPYEYASIQEITDFFQARGFRRVKAIPTQGFTGCNEFIFEKVA